MAAILEFCIKMKSKRQINIWFGILVIEFIEKMYFHKVIGALVQNLIFQNGLSAIFDFGLWKKLPGFLGETWRLNFYKGSKEVKSIVKPH